MITIQIDLNQENFDHPTMKEVLENKIEQLRSATFELKTLVESLSSAGFDWASMDELQEGTIEALVATILHKLNS